MSDPKQRKQPPTINDEIDKTLDALEGSAGVVTPRQREPRPITEVLDFSKLRFGQQLIGWCVFLIAALSLVDFFFRGDRPENSTLESAIEILKLMATTALGFVFAKTQDLKRSSKP